MTRRAGYRPLFLIGVLGVLVCFEGRTNAEQALSLELIDTSLKTESQWIPIIGTTTVFSPTTVSCPLGGCTIRVEVSSAIAFTGSGVEGLRMRALVDGLAASPGAVQALQRPMSQFLPRNETATFSWMMTGVTAGFHTVDMVFFSDVNVQAGRRTLIVQVYKYAPRRA